MNSHRSIRNKQLDKRRKLRKGTIQAANAAASVVAPVTAVFGALIVFWSLVDSQAFGSLLAKLGSFSGVIKIALATAGTAIVAVLVIRTLAVDLMSLNKHDN